MANIKGVDVSIYQGDINFDALKSDASFIIPKATEGSGLVDRKLSRNQSEARRVGMGLGYYHFARPDLGNTPEAEAQYFINSFWPANKGEVFVLDYEVRYADPVGWSKKWLDYIAKKTNGTKPLIYLNKSLMQSYNWSPVINAGYGLWLAYYDNNPTDIPFNTPWPVVAMKQYTSTGRVAGISGNADVNTFFGDLATFKKYGYITGTTVSPFKARCETLKIATSRVDVELGKDLSNPDANYEAIYNATQAKIKKINETGAL